MKILTVQKRWFNILLLGGVLLWGCAPGLSNLDTLQETEAMFDHTPTGTGMESDVPTAAVSEAVDAEDQIGVDGETMDNSSHELADVISVQVSGGEGAYQFSVEVSSPDTGCDQYADWWEIVTEVGELVYRRVLLHSHVGEQPFTRSGGPVAIDASTQVWVRAHMNTGGYGGMALRGSVQAGFEPADLDPDFAPGLADEPPLPEDCAF